MMKKRLLFLMFSFWVGVACASHVDEGPKALATLVAQIPPDLPSVRGERHCELFELAIEDDNFVLLVWNNASMGHTCPDEWLAEIDRQAYFVDGPRWRSLDLQLQVDENRTLLYDSQRTLADRDAVISEVPAGLGLDMFLAAKVTIAPVSRVAQNAGISINSLEDVPPDLKQRLMSGRATEESVAYEVIEVDRQQNTLWVYEAGHPIYLLADGECHYAMKYYQNAQNPNLTNEAAIADLGAQFQQLPTSYTYEVRTFAEDRFVLDLDGRQYVIADEFGNSYDRMWCGEEP